MRPRRGRGFPASSLEPDGGRLYSWIFENELVKLRRNHFWSFTIEFKPFEYKGQEVKPSMTIEWVVLKIRRWQDLEGLRLGGAYGDDGIEASFYAWEHDFGSRFRIEVLERQRARFRVRMAMTVEFNGYDGTDADPALEVRAECWLPYEGLMVPARLGNTGISTAHARRLSEEFLDMSGYGHPRGKGRTFPPRP